MIPFPVFEDERGRLVPVEFTDLPFAPQRVFVVTAAPLGSRRGDHLSTCTELLVLVAGSARVRARAPDSDAGIERELAVPGESCVVQRGEHIDYELTVGSVLLVLADRSYEG